MNKKTDPFIIWFEDQKAINDMRHSYYKEIGDMYYKQNMEMLQGLKFVYITFILGLLFLAVVKFFS